MKIVKLIAVPTLATTVALAVLASASEQVKPSSEVEGSPATMPMMGAQQGGMMTPQMMQKMQNRMAMQRQHMQTMETHLANIEALLRQLVELQKQK